MQMSNMLGVDVRGFGNKLFICCSRTFISVNSSNLLLALENELFVMIINKPDKFIKQTLVPSILSCHLHVLIMFPLVVSSLFPFTEFRGENYGD